MNAGSFRLSDRDLSVAYPTIVFTIVALAIYAGSTAAAITGRLGIGWAIAINALMAYALFTSMHEAAHLNISGSKKSLRWIDEIFGWVSGIPLLAPFYLFKVIHFRHHAHTNDPEKDPDHWLASKNILSLLFHSTTIFPAYLIKGMKIHLFDKGTPAKVKRELSIGNLGLLFFLAVFLIGGHFTGYGLLAQIWLIPVLIAQTFLAVTFDWLPHHPHFETARYKNTRVIDIPALTWILIGQNYHLVHHLYPRIPFYNYRKTYRKIEEKVKEKGVEIIT